METRTGKVSGQPEQIKLTCGNCINNDNGLCDKLGYLVGDDDSPHCRAEWESNKLRE